MFGLFSRTLASVIGLAALGVFLTVQILTAEAVTAAWEVHIRRFPLPPGAALPAMIHKTLGGAAFAGALIWLVVATIGRVREQSQTQNRQPLVLRLVTFGLLALLLLTSTAGGIAWVTGNRGFGHIHGQLMLALIALLAAQLVIAAIRIARDLRAL